MPWDVLEKKRADPTYTPGVRSSSYIQQYTTLTVLFRLRRMPKRAPIVRINNDGEYRKAPFNLFSATANWRKCLKKSNFKSLRRIAKDANLFLSTTANRKIVNDFFAYCVEFRKAACIFFPAYGYKKGRNIFFRLLGKMLRAQNRVLQNGCTQPASPRLLHKTAIF